MVDKEILFIDTETYANAAFLGARNESRTKEFRYWIRYEGENKENIRELLTGPYIFVSFNGIYFDQAILAAMYAGVSPREIKGIANQLITYGAKPWFVTRPFRLAYEKVKRASHIDLLKVAPQPTQSLKMYGARLNAPTIIENPYHHESNIEPGMEPMVERYCIDGDLVLTELLFKDLEKPLQLRVDMSKEYGVDMRSKSDSQMAEAIFVKKLGLSRQRNISPPEYVTFTPPSYIKFDNPVWNEVLEVIKNEKFYISDTKGHVQLPKSLNLKLESKTGRYQMGIGGLHSIHDKKQCHIAGDGWEILDIDGTSYYTNVILINDLVPKSLGREFLNEYRTIYMRRLEAKKVKDQSTMDSLRIALNGTFGKTSDLYSPLYSPDLTMAIVLTGQLTLLMVIEWLEKAGAIIISANTDGIMIKYRTEDKEKILQTIVDFERDIGYPFEHTAYRCVALKDVNNYFAVKTDRTIKAKGLYTKQDLRKNPSAGICNIAVGNWLTHGKSLEESIRSGKMKDYFYVRNVNKEGGGMYGNERLGRVVRWYKTNRLNPLNFTYVSGGAKIARTDNSAALQAYDPAGPLPDDLDYNSYLREAIRIIQDVGAEKYLTEAERLLLPEPKRRKRKKANE
jgi:hypothetical protein